MRPLRYIFGILASICLIIVLLIGSVEYGFFYQRDFWEETFAEEKSYETVGMSLEDEVALANHMLDYCQGKYDELSFITTMWGEKRDFFNQREKDHMIDVRALNHWGVTVLRISFELFILLLLIVLSISFKTSAKGYARNMILKTLSISMLVGTLCTACIGGMIAAYAAKDFDLFWIKIHHIFFTGNDLWLLDPSKDMLINVTTGTLFEKLVIRCATIFAISLLTMLILCTLYLVLAKKKQWVIQLGVSLLLSAALLGSQSTYADDTVSALSNAPELVSSSAILIDAESGELLYAKNSDAAAFPASTTKVMTALLALENLKLSDTVTFSKTAIYALTPGASHIGMTIGENLTAEQCLYGLLLPSANEVANALAEAVDGSMEAFVTHMNVRAAELGCRNTHFANPNGLHDPEHYTCAYDLAQIFKACISTPGFLTIDSKASYVIPKTNLVDEARPMRTTHLMMRTDSEYYDPRVTGGKTGHTDEALGCLITYAQDGGRSLICVVLHALQPGQYTDTRALLDYGFERFSKISSKTLSEYLFGSEDSAFSFISEDVLPVLTVDSSALLLLPSDLSELDWSYDDGQLHMTSGSLTLSSIPCRTSSLENSIYDGGLLPIEKLPKLQIEPPTENHLPIILLIVFITVVLILLIILVLRSRFATNIRKRRNTHIIRNPGTKNIKI